MGGGPKVQKIAAPTPPPPPPPPTIESADVKARDDVDAFNRRRGTQSNIKAGSNAAAPTTQASALLGA